MLLIFGTRAFETIVTLVAMVCPHCHVEASQTVVKVVNRFTLFFIPLFSVSTKYFVECSNCGVVTSLTEQQANAAASYTTR